MKISSKKVVNAVSGVLLGGSVGNSLNNLGFLNYWIIAISIVAFFLTFDIGLSLEEKAVQNEHDKADLQLLENELKKEQVRKSIESLKNGGENDI